MRVLFVPLTGATHWFPQVPLAWALSAAGHEVRVAAQPSIVDVVTRSGMTAVPVGASYDFAEHSTDLLKEAQRRLGRLPASPAEAAEAVRTLPPDVLRDLEDAKYRPHVRSADAIAADVLPFAREWRPHLVIADHGTLAGPLVAESLGVPLIRHLFGPYYGSKVPFPGRGMPADAWPEQVLDLFGRYGVEPRPDYCARTVDPCPDSMQVPDVPNRVPMRYVPYNDSAPQPEWLRVPAERRRVCVTLGTLTERSVAGSTQSLVQRITGALAGLDVETVIAVRSGSGGALGDLPDGARVVHDVPLHLLVRTCAAIVHHGGAGNALTSACHGVPQIAVTQVPDNTFESGRLAATGAGVVLPAAEAGVDDIKRAAAAALDEDGMRAAAARLRREIEGQPAPAQVAGVLQELVHEELI